MRGCGVQLCARQRHAPVVGADRPPGESLRGVTISDQVLSAALAIFRAMAMTVDDEQRPYRAFWAPREAMPTASFRDTRRVPAARAAAAAAGARPASMRPEAVHRRKRSFSDRLEARSYCRWTVPRSSRVLIGSSPIGRDCQGATGARTSVRLCRVGMRSSAHGTGRQDSSSWPSSAEASLRRS